MHIFPTLIINFNLLSMIVNLWWSSLCGEIGSKEMLSAWLPGGNWMLKVTAQDVHILCIYFHRMLPSCPYKYLSHPPIPLWAVVHFLVSDLEHPVASWQPSRQHLWKFIRVKKYALCSSWKKLRFRIRVAKIYDFLSELKKFTFFVRVGKIYTFLIRFINVIFQGQSWENWIFSWI